MKNSNSDNTGKNLLLQKSLKTISALITTVFVTSLISACGILGYTYEPTFFAKPKFYSAKETAAINLPEVPVPELKTVEFSYKTQQTPLSENSHYTFTDKQRLIKKEANPSVIVIMPKQSSPMSAGYDRKLIEHSLTDNGFKVTNVQSEIEGFDALSVTDQLKKAEGKAKYAFIVNELSAKPRSQVEQLDLSRVPSSGYALSQLKDFLPPAKHRLITRKIPAPGFQARLNAKLIKLSTGSIVWLGRYAMNSSDLKDFKVTFSAEKFTTNEKQILSRVYNFNNRVNQQASKLAQAKQRYQSTFSAATTPKDFDDEEDMLKFAKKVKKDYRHAEQTYIHTYEAGLRLPEQKSKVEKSINWKYNYNLARPYVSPSIEALSTPPLVSSQKGHIEQLLELTVKPLIAAIRRDADETIAAAP